MWTEAEDEGEAERLCADLDDLLELETYAEGFAEEPIDAQIARLCRDLGLPDSDAAEPPPPIPDAAPAWRSSA